MSPALTSDSIEDSLPVDHAKAETGQVILSRVVEVGQDRRLAPQQGTLGLNATIGNALNNATGQIRVVLAHGDVVEEEQRLGPGERQSLTDIATRSMPTVSCLFVAKASLSFVPTPSVEATSTGSR